MLLGGSLNDDIRFIDRPDTARIYLCAQLAHAGRC
jgi:hypothetical protein